MRLTSEKSESRLVNLVATTPRKAALFSRFPRRNLHFQEKGSRIFAFAARLYFALARGSSFGVFCSSANSKPLRYESFTIFAIF